jgi:type IV secretion system protein VirB10
MAVREISDPRLQALFGASDPREAGVRPTVRLPRKGLPPVVIGAVALLLAVLLFSVLNARRTTQQQPSVTAHGPDSEASGWTAPPPLYIPPVQEPVAPPAPLEQEKPAPIPLAAPTPSPAARTVPAPSVTPQPPPQFAPVPAPAPAPPERVSSGSPLVIDVGNGSALGNGTPATGASPAGVSSQSITRIRASALANRSMTVPQGYLIPAVLETGFDSTKPGFARAIVSRDVRGFDGKNVLIPRGSRLIGEYHSDAAAGQKRAIITWTRLMRPDGMTIALDSPAVDTLGRGGVAASVNSHFFARLGDALLQTTFGIGQALAGRAVTGPVVVLQGNSTQVATQIATPHNYVPTLTVPPGKSISVFVAHDLDFTAAGSLR